MQKLLAEFNRRSALRVTPGKVHKRASFPTEPETLKNHPGTITNAMYLTNIFSGFEIWTGGVGLETTSFCAGVN